jgi:hypothetical protein
VPGEGTEELSGRQIPEPKGAVISAREDASAVGGHRHRADPVLVPGECTDQGRGLAARPPEQSKASLAQRGQPPFGAGFEIIDTQQKCAIPDLLSKQCGAETLIPYDQIVSFALEQAEKSLESSTDTGGPRGAKFEDGDQVLLEME